MRRRRRELQTQASKPVSGNYMIIFALNYLHCHFTSISSSVDFRSNDMLSEVEKRKKRQELRSKVISRIVKVNIEVAGYKFMRSGGSKK